MKTSFGSFFSGDDKSMSSGLIAGSGIEFRGGVSAIGGAGRGGK